MTCFIQLFSGLDFLHLKLEVISLTPFNSGISVNRFKLIADKKLFLEQFRYQMIATHCLGVNTPSVSSVLVHSHRGLRPNGGHIRRRAPLIDEFSVFPADDRQQDRR